MPAIANIALVDAKGTPVTHTFAPVSAYDDTGKLANRAASIPAGYETLQLELRQPTSSSAAYRMIGKMSFPTVQTVDGVDTVTKVSSLSFQINFAQTSSSQDRKDIVKMLSGLFTNTLVVTMADNLEPLY